MVVGSMGINSFYLLVDNTAKIIYVLIKKKINFKVPSMRIDNILNR
jgi:hypothetical protein